MWKNKSYFRFCVDTFVAILLVFTFFNRPVWSAEIKEVESQYCDYELSGELILGDYDRFVAQGFFPTDSDDPWDSPLYGRRLCLNSAGGSILEGLRLFEGIWNSKVVTVVGPTMRCESACALAFLGGGNIPPRTDALSGRYIFPGARLGFHAPGLSLPNQQSFTESQIESAFTAAIAASSILMNMLDVEHGGLTPININLLRKILSTPSSTIEYIETLGEAALFNIDVVGIPLGEFGKDAVVNVCDASYLRTFGATYMGRERANIFASDSTYSESNFLKDLLSESATWRGVSDRQLDNLYRKSIDFVDVPTSEIDSWERFYLGAVTGYPGYQSHNFICVVSLHELLSDVPSVTEAGTDWIGSGFSVEFFAYRFHDDLSDFGETLGRNLLNGSAVGESGNFRFTSVVRSWVPFSFMNDLSSNFHNYSLSLDLGAGLLPTQDEGLWKLNNTDQHLSDEFRVPEWCPNAASSTEVAICENETLSRLDIEISDYYRRLRRHNTAASVARERLELRNRCLDDVDCILRVTQETRDIFITFLSDRTGSSTGQILGTLSSCWLTSPTARVTNVNEYVNLRRQPDFSARVIRQVPLGEQVRVLDHNTFHTGVGSQRERDACGRSCQAFGRDSNDAAARDQAQQCIEDNMLWYEITDARGNRGWVSRKFLEEVE